MFDKKNPSRMIFLNESNIAINVDKIVLLKSQGSILVVCLEGGFTEEIESPKDIQEINKIFQ